MAVSLEELARTQVSGFVVEGTNSSGFRISRETRSPKSQAVVWAICVVSIVTGIAVPFLLQMHVIGFVMGALQWGFGILFYLLSLWRRELKIEPRRIVIEDHVRSYRRERAIEVSNLRHLALAKVTGEGGDQWQLKAHKLEGRVTTVLVNSKREPLETLGTAIAAHLGVSLQRDS